MRHFDIDFVLLFFEKKLMFFLRNGFPSPLTVPARSNLLFIQWKFFELYERICPAMLFFNSSNRFLFRLTLTFSMTFSGLLLKFVCVTSFLLLGRLRDLPHSKK